MSGLSNFIKDLLETKGTNNKKDLTSIFIQNEEDRNLLSDYLKTVYSTENLYQSKINKELEAPSLFSAHEVDMTALSAYKFFMNGERRGFEGERRLSMAYNKCPPEEQQLLEYIVRGEIKCGIGALTWNKIFGEELIYIPRYQRCSKLTDRNHEKWDGIIVQEKEDAQFVNICINDNTCEMKTRNWKSTVNSLFNKVTDVLDQQNLDLVLMGEIYVTDTNGERFGREKSNGLINGVAQTGEDFSEECGGLDIVLWDAIDTNDFNKGKSDVEYDERFETLKFSINSLIVPALESNGLGNVKLSAIKSAQVKDMDGVKTIFKEILKRKGEGVVIKNPKGAWAHSDGGHKDIVKVKIKMNVKLRIVGFNEAEETSRHSKTFASLQMQSEDGRIVTAVSGMSDLVREMINNDRENFMNKICEVKCNGIQYNPEEPHSLYYANFIDFRADVNAAQDFDDIEKVLDSAVEAIDMI